MTIVCPACGSEVQVYISIPKSDGSKEAHCNLCYTWFIITKEGSAAKKSAISAPTPPRKPSETPQQPRPAAASQEAKASHPPTEEPKSTQTA